jgi:hypothetical protein
MFKVLLLGEYSGVHTELSKALKSRGHQVFFVSDGDGFKSYHPNYSVNYPPRNYVNLFSRIYNIFLAFTGLIGYKSYKKNFRFLKDKLVNYDVVQLINPIVFGGYGWLINLHFLSFIHRNNKHVFLSVLGTDYYVNKYLYSIRYTPYSSNVSFYVRIKRYLHSLFLIKLVNDYAISISDRVMPCMYYYHQAYSWNRKRTPYIIPLPVGLTNIGKPIKLIDGEPIVIFHGWQIGREKEKGNEVFDRVIRRIQMKYGEKIKYILVKNIPYNEYLRLFGSAHIFIDQLYADDTGMNGLLGMAAGKVVFSGFMQEAMSLYPNYNLKSIIGISASKNEDELFLQFSRLIDNPSAIETISKNAIKFILRYHLSSIIVDEYTSVWNDTIFGSTNS